METVGSRGRRTALSMLLGSALVVLLTVTSGGAAGAQPQDAPGVVRAEERGGGIHFRSDVYMRDDPTDAGHEPSTGTAYASPDIKVCHTSTECAISQDPIVGGTNWVFVKLHRPGPLEGGSKAYGWLELYFAYPGGGLAWPSSWTKIGEEWKENVPYGTTTVRFTWTGAPGPGTVPLLARWVSPTDPMTHPETAFTLLNVMNNNNITIRYIETVVINIGTPKFTRFTSVPNLPFSASTSIVVTQPSGPSFRDVGGQVSVDLGQSLFERWRQGGLAGTNVRHVGGTQVEILDPARASLDNIVLHPGERFTLDVRFSARAASAETYLVKVALWGPVAPNEKPIDLGGVLYEITVSDQERSK